MDEPLRQTLAESGFDLLAALESALLPDEIRVQGYVVLGPIARGGMGAVFRARQLQPERDVALKVMLPQLASDAEMRARFYIEARAMAALEHPGILPVYEVGEANGSPFFSMKFVSGGTLAQRLRNGPLAPREAAGLVLRIARAVHFAHQRGVLHRDLKPANFLFDESGSVFVSDFGLAKLPFGKEDAGLTRTGAFLGTPHYMPPEALSGSAAGTTVSGDLYSLGAVLYECLCGCVPHGRHESIAPLLRAIVEEPIPMPSTLRAGIPRDLQTICLKALERSPASRYASAADFADDLENWLGGRPIAARRTGAAERLWFWARRHPLPAGLAAALAITTATGAVLLTVSHRERGIALEEARRQLRRALIDQARSQRLLGAPGHRDAALRLLREAADIGISQEIRDEAIALLAREDVTPAMAPASPVHPRTPASWGEGDAIASAVFSPDGRWCAAFHESGRASLGARDSAKPGRTWEAHPGRAIRGAFLAGTSSLLLAETEKGILLASPDPGTPDRVLQEPGSMIAFLQPDQPGDGVLLGRADALELLDTRTGATSWRATPGPVRCSPAWSPDGAHVAAALGETAGITLFDSRNGLPRWTQRTTAWPVVIEFHPGGRLLACATDENAILLCDRFDGRIRTRLAAPAGSLRFPGDGTHLIATDAAGVVRAWELVQAPGFGEWTPAPRNEPDGTEFGLALSPDGRFALTTATAGIRIWSVAEGHETGFHPVENQRIDAPTDAWWLPGTKAEMLVQVPGGLERVPVSDDGRPGTPQRVARPPGSTVLDVTADGTWLVTSVDPEAPACEAWPGGNAAQARPVPRPPGDNGPVSAHSGGKIATLLDQDVIEYFPGGNRPAWRLTPPGRPGITALAFIRDGTRLMLLGRDHRVFVWNLSRLETELAARKF